MPKLSKKTIIIIISAILAVALAVLCVFIVIKLTKKPVSSTLPQLSNNEPAEQPPNKEEQPKEKIKLVITSPTQTKISTTEASFCFTGNSDPSIPLTLNGNEVNREKNGIFSVTVNLNVGDNTFTFSHADQTVTYTVNYRYVIIKSYYPNTKQTYSCGSTFGVTVNARNGSNVTASFNGQTITLTKKVISADDDNAQFVDYIGSFTLPSNNLSDLSLGAVTFTAKYNGKSESFKSANIICKKPDFIVDYDPAATPVGPNYINVGSGLIAEIVDDQAETFDAYSTNDYSRPTNNYLPKGTVDYCAPGSVYYKDSKEYKVMRFGKQVYTTRKNVPGNQVVKVIELKAGTLPDHNQIAIDSFETNTTHTVLTLNTEWKAPFYFNLREQAYANPSIQDYSITSPTFNFVDITFCYSTVFEGEIEIPEDHPIFKSVDIIKNQSDYTLRLHLKKQGGFYGWTCNYNKNGQLVFEFLNPVQVKAGDNKYFTDLTGARILIDVGHGGKDPGTVSFSKTYTEAERNLNLANKLKAELEALGATVYMTRTSDITSTNDDKLKMLRDIKPDFCIAIHHNGNSSSKPSGFDSLYGTPFSKKAAEFINTHTQNTGLYSRYKLAWHYYYMARSTVCPVVLTENGFLTNTHDYNNIISPEITIQKVEAITKGIIEYFNSIKS